MGFASVRGRILPFPYLQAVAVNTVLALRRSLWYERLVALEWCYFDDHICRLFFNSCVPM